MAFRAVDVLLTLFFVIGLKAEQTTLEQVPETEKSSTGLDHEGNACARTAGSEIDVEVKVVDSTGSSQVCRTRDARMTSSSKNSFYQVRPLTGRALGAEVVGIDLMRQDFGNSSFFAQVKADIRRHRLLLFRGQKGLSGARQVAFSEGLGRVESTFYKHPRSPHPDIFRVSNDEREGCTNVGRSGWHIDGTFMRTPFMYQTMYFDSVAAGGDTLFMPLREFYATQDEETRKRWATYWMLTGRRAAPIHPLVYQHPFRQDPTLLFHCGEPFCSGWLVLDEDEDRSRQSAVSEAHFEQQKNSTEETNRRTSMDQENTGNMPSHDAFGSSAQLVVQRGPAREVKLPERPMVLASTDVQNEITEALERAMDSGLGLRMQWVEGDFAINDNLGLAHYASPGTQGDRRTQGLRILHRTTIIGGDETVPRKADGRESFFA